MTFSTIPGHESWGQNSWHGSRSSKVPMVQIWMLFDEWDWWDIPHLRNVNSTNVMTNIHINGQTERRKLNTTLHKWRGYKYKVLLVHVLLNNTGLYIYKYVLKFPTALWLAFYSCCFTGFISVWSVRVSMCKGDSMMAISNLFWTTVMSWNFGQTGLGKQCRPRTGSFGCTTLR